MSCKACGYDPKTINLEKLTEDELFALERKFHAEIIRRFPTSKLYIAATKIRKNINEKQDIICADLKAFDISLINYKQSYQDPPRKYMEMEMEFPDTDIPKF